MDWKGRKVHISIYIYNEQLPEWILLHQYGDYLDTDTLNDLVQKYPPWKMYKIEISS